MQANDCESNEMMKKVNLAPELERLSPGEKIEGHVQVVPVLVGENPGYDSDESGANGSFLGSFIFEEGLLENYGRVVE